MSLLMRTRGRCWCFPTSFRKMCLSHVCPAAQPTQSGDFGKTLRIRVRRGLAMAPGVLNLKPPAKTWQRRISVHRQGWDGLTFANLFVHPLLGT